MGIGTKTFNDIHECCRCGERKLCEEYKDIVGGDDWNWWCKECLVIESLSEVAKSVLLYLETCLVDQYGRVEARRMNSDDFEAIQRFVQRKWVKFGVLRRQAVEKLRGMGKVYTHWIRFSNIAWKVTHQLRKERADRMLERNKEKLDKEKVRNR